MTDEFTAERMSPPKRCEVAYTLTTTAAAAKFKSRTRTAALCVLLIALAAAAGRIGVTQGVLQLVQRVPAVTGAELVCGR
jgi:uncharacterized protein HemX